MPDDRLAHYYRVLGLEPPTTEEAIKRAHRDLVQVWHPDRFTANPRLQKLAQDRLREINEACEALRSRPLEPPPAAPPSAPPRPPQAPPAPPVQAKRPRCSKTQIAAHAIGAATITFAFIMAAASFYRWLSTPVGPPAIAASSDLPAPGLNRDTPAPSHSIADPPVANGQELFTARGRRGIGRVTVVNRTSLDAAASLVDSDGEALRMVYVSAGRQATIRDIAPGIYHLRVISGAMWSPEAREFTASRTASNAAGPFCFSQVQSTGSLSGDQYEVVLRPPEVSR